MNAYQINLLSNLSEDSGDGDDSAIGAAIESIAGAMGAENTNPASHLDLAAEDSHWRTQLPMHPYYDNDFTFDQDYVPAYAFGYFLRVAFPTETFDDLEIEYHRDWWRIRGISRLEWEYARGAAADAWDRCNARLAPPAAVWNRVDQDAIA